jgi:hypothetical protein
MEESAARSETEAKSSRVGEVGSWRDVNIVETEANKS